MKKLILFLLGTVCAVASLQGQQISTHRITGVILSAKDGTPLVGVTVKLKSSTKGTITDAEGHFSLRDIAAGTTLVVSSIGYEKKEITINGKDLHLSIRLNPASNLLDETIIRGYGTTTQRLNTGSISTITAKEIAQQPVTNVLAALSGRMPGVYVQTQNGLPGGGVSIQIRGKNSISAGTDPLYIIDGVPYPSSSLVHNSALGNAINGEISPFSSLNSEDIESISILKDADATAIYGSRGANGVILITTKKGASGKTRVNISVNQGIRKAANLPHLLNLKQYLQIREEAFKNEDITPSADPTSPNYAPDLMVWDTTRSINWAEYFMGGSAGVTDIQADISGGNRGTTFRIGGSYHSENTILPGTNRYQRIGVNIALHHTSTDKKFSADLSTFFYWDNNKFSNTSGYTQILQLPPNFPVYDPTSHLNWSMNINPIAAIKNRSNAVTDNQIINTALKYSILPGLDAKLSIGYNKLNTEQTMIYPKSAQNPNYNPFGYTYFGHSYSKAVIVEPQLTYALRINESTFNFLLGGSYQNTTKNSETVYAKGFTNEALMGDIGSASQYNPFALFREYKYVSLFGQITYALKEKYIINASARRDGSSRFGPGDRFGNFGAVGAAWIFSEENLMKNIFPFLSYGKIRGSYGITGNDQIADYQYLATYKSSNYLYQDDVGLQPSRIANANFHWESNRKLDIAIELGLWNDRILFTADWYQNRSGDQLVNYSIPYLTGFNYYQANLPALVENSGWEIAIHTKNIQHHNFTWSTNFNITTPKNRLKEFPNLSNSSYANTLVVGEDITRAYGYKFLGINGTTGTAEYASQDGTASSSPYFFSTIGKGTPDFYGGIGNTFTYKQWDLSVFCQFEKHSLKGGLIYTPGILINNFTLILNRWQHHGDQTKIPKSSTRRSDYRYYSSSANYFDIPYLRLKNISFSYSLTKKILNHFKIQDFRIYTECQNLWTWWNTDIPVYDPETGSRSIPPMKTFVVGFKITF